jgi:NAD(P)-dependent dehydrogenase (short-subunit alcohol dehydrogenase family)
MGSMKLKDKVVVITGSSSGIGQATAEAFAKEGAKIVVNSNHNTVGGEAVAKALGSQAIHVQADVGMPEGAHKVLDAAIAKWGQVDVLINNAGVGKAPGFVEATPEEIMQVLHDNLMSTIYCSQYAIKLAQKRDGVLKILNTTSVRGWEFGGRTEYYAAAKAAVNNLTRTLAKNYAPNVIVNAVGPGVTKTPNYDKYDQKLIDTFMNQTQLHRWVWVEEIADAFLFLVKNDAITGEIIYVDAGFRVRD